MKIMIKFIVFTIWVIVAIFCFIVFAKAETLTASWYSLKSLQKEGTFKRTKGRCADGSMFSDDRLICASNDYPMHSLLRITNLANNKVVICLVTDRIANRYAGERIDLSKSAFSRIGILDKGLLPVKVERIK